MRVRALRGATTLDADIPEQMRERVPELVGEIMTRNGLVNDDVISVWFTTTPEINSLHPATTVRNTLGFTDVPMLGATEMAVSASVPMCVRVMLHVETERERADLQHVYLHGAVALRPDLAGS